MRNQTTAVLTFEDACKQANVDLKRPHGKCTTYEMSEIILENVNELALLPTAEWEAVLDKSYSKIDRMRSYDITLSKADRDSRLLSFIANGKMVDYTMKRLTEKELTTKEKIEYSNSVLQAGLALTCSEIMPVEECLSAIRKGLGFRDEILTLSELSFILNDAVDVARKSTVLAKDVDYAIANRISSITKLISGLLENDEEKRDEFDGYSCGRSYNDASVRDIYSIITSRVPLVAAVKLLVNNYRRALPISYYAFITEMKNGNEDAIAVGGRLPKMEGMMNAAGISNNYDIFGYFYNPNIASYDPSVSLDEIQNDILAYLDRPVQHPSRNEFLF